jgi:Protein of unknown function (DUF4238)
MFAEMRGAGVGAVIATMTSSRDIFDKSIDRSEGELGPLDEETRDRMFETSKRYTINVERTDGLGALGISKKMAEIFYKMEWDLLKPENPSEFFVTSDHPVTRIIPQRSHSVYGDGGFMNPNVQVTFPLSPDRLLILTWGPIDAQNHYLYKKD